MVPAYTKVKLITNAQLQT